MHRDSVVVVGAGVAGLVAALELAAEGIDVTVVERSDQPGGKMREVIIGGHRLDAGPTVFTMRWVFEEIFAKAGASLAECLELQQVETLARHAWGEGGRMDLFADVRRSADAVGALAGPAEARRFLEFCQAARKIYQTLEAPFIRASRPNPASLVGRVGPFGLGRLWQIRPYQTMWSALGDYFHDQRLRQLFGRYATYNGSSPFLAPATLMLIAHVEQAGVWLVRGGMHQVAMALARLAEAKGANVRYGAEVAEILTAGGRTAGVRLANGETLRARAVVVNADVAALASGRLGRGVAHAVDAVPRAARSLSAVTWNMVAETRGFPLLRHTVFFSRDYADEFDAIFRRSCLPHEPTVYVCAQDRGDRDEALSPGAERLLFLANAPACGDSRAFDQSEIEQCERRAFALMEHCGLQVHKKPEMTIVTTPSDFERLFPATGGALYGQATHGWKASFIRPGTRSRVPGLYLAGGSTHPGAGVPMAALSGRLAATCVHSDLISTSRSRAGATRGGMSTR